MRSLSKMKTSGTIEEKPISGFNFAITFEIHGFVAFVWHIPNVRATVIQPPANLRWNWKMLIFRLISSSLFETFSWNEFRIDAFLKMHLIFANRCSCKEFSFSTHQLFHSLTGNSMMFYFSIAICYITRAKFTSSLHLAQECILYIRWKSSVYSAVLCRIRGTIFCRQLTKWLMKMRQVMHTTEIHWICSRNAFIILTLT